MTERYIAIGKVVAPHGNKGEVKVYPLTDFPSRFTGTRRVYLTGPDYREILVDKARFHKGFVLLKLEGYDTINQAESLRGKVLTVPREELVKLGPGEYYLFEVIGLEVYTVDNRWLGTVKDVIRGPANDVYVVGPIGGDKEKEYLIPALKSVVKGIDLKEKVMTIDPIPGLLD